jgi:hypothetical protein
MLRHFSGPLSMMAIEETDAILFRLAWQWKRPPGKMRSTMDDEVVWQDTRLGDKRKVELLEESMGFTKSSYSKSGFWNSRKDEAIRRLSRLLFHMGYFDVSKIHDGVLLACRTGFVLTVVMMGR